MGIAKFACLLPLAVLLSVHAGLFTWDDSGLRFSPDKVRSRIIEAVGGTETNESPL